MAEQIQLDIAINTATSAQSLGELRRSLRELISLQDQVGKDSAGFSKLSKAINDTEGKIGDLNDSFSTLRGSGVERLNASLGLLKEGFLAADPEKISIGMDGLKAAMSAIPILALVTGLQLLVTNFDTVVAALNDTRDSTLEAQKALEDYTEAFERLNSDLSVNNDLNNSRTAIIESQIALLKEQKAPAEEIIKLLQQENNIKIQNASNELTRLSEQKRLAEETLSLNRDRLSNLADQTNGLKKLSDEQKKQQDEYNKNIRSSIEIVENYQSRVEIVNNGVLASNQNLITESKSLRDKENDEAEKAAAAEIARHEKVLQDNYKASQEYDAKLIADNKKVLDSFKDNRKENVDNFKTTDEQLQKLEDETSNLFGKSIEKETKKFDDEKKKQLDIDKKFMAARVQLAEQALNAANSIAEAITNNENLRLNEQQYARNEAFYQDQVRVQQTLDQETAKTNALLSNDDLTSEEREKIQNESEKRKYEINKTAVQNKYQLDLAQYKAESEAKKKQFEREKALRAANAIIDTASAIVKTGAELGYPAAIPFQVAAGILGATQLGLILAQKFDAGEAPKPPIIPAFQTASSGGGSSSTGPSQSSLFGTGGRFNEGENVNGERIIRAIVVESDITNSQKRISKIKSSSELENENP